VAFWREPELPKIERMPRRRMRDDGKKGGPLARAVAAVAGLVLGASAIIGAWRSLGNRHPEGRGGIPLMALAMLLPAGLLVRYAWTGKIKGMPGASGGPPG
jgi:hypothetical protein